MLTSIVGAVVLAASCIVQPEPERSGPSPEAVFLEAWRVVNSAFYDPKMNGVDWEAVKDELLPRAREVETTAEVSPIINEALSRLKASHTGHFTQDQREYYEVLDVFYPEGVPEGRGSKIRPGFVQYTGVGLAATVIDGHVFAADVYSGGPADEAGILVGDELISVEGEPWGDVAPFRARRDMGTKVVIQRGRDEDSRMEVVVAPRRIRPHELFLSAMSAGARVVEKDGFKIGYVRIRSYANVIYQERLKELVETKFAGCDALVVDIRGGWGGASPEYMDIFNPAAPTLSHVSRDGDKRQLSPAWHRPVVMLIDHGSRSGKEMIAYAFKKHHIGVLVGERTAGAVLGGTVRPLMDGSLLFVAVTDVRVDGEKLEGVGVEPDVRVERDLPYSAGKDPQMEAAVEAAAGLCRGR